MAIFSLTNAQVLVNGVDLSDHCDQVTVTDMRDSIDITTFGASSKAVTKGLGDAKIELQLFQDFAAGKVHATLQPLIGSSTPVQVEVRAVNGARSATNPGIVMQGLLMSYSALDGAMNQASKLKAEFTNGSNAGMSYPTS